MFVKIVFISPLDTEPLQGKRKRISTLINIDMISSISMLGDRFDSWWVFMANASYELPKSENELFGTYINEHIYVPTTHPVHEVIHFAETIEAPLERIIDAL